MLYLYLSALKDLGAPILYDRTQKTYYYGENGRIALAFIKNKLL
jgi:predicted metal-dependent phosphotriesterase family hydrolase